jgi:hypothetical protein
MNEPWNRSVAGRVGFSSLVLLFLVSAVVTADAHHRHHRHMSDQDPSRDPTLVSPGKTGPLGVLMGELIKDCSREANELKILPVDAIAAAITPDTSQNSALMNIHNAAVTAANTLASTCPKDAPQAPLDRLAAVDRGIDAVQAAFNMLEEPLQAFYQLLSNEQRARLVARYPVATIETTGAAPKRRHSRRKDNDTTDAAPSAPRVWDCEQWEAELRAWPITQAEQVVQPSARQRGSFYEFAASLQYAADSLDDSCPQQVAPTPIGRLQDMKEKLDALHQSTALMRVPLEHFYETLDGGQKDRLAAVM